MCVCVCVCVCVFGGCQFFMMGLTLSTEHEQTLSDSTVYQWNIPLPFPFPPTITRSAQLSSSVSPSLSASFHPSLVQFFISGSIFLTSSHSSSSSRHLSLLFCLPPLGCQSVVPALCLSLSHEINMLLHVVATCQSSYDSQQHVHSCGPTRA